MPATRAPLTRTRVIEGGLVLADRDGVAGLTMRRLAASLGFEVMALYNHVSSKGDLLDGMLEAVGAEVTLESDPADWRSSIRRSTQETAAALRRHPWAAPLWLSRPPGPSRLDLMEALLDALQHSGADQQDVDRAFHAIVNHVVGFAVAASTLSEGASGDPPTARDLEPRPRVAAHIAWHARGRSAADPDPFTFTLDAILDAVEPPRAPAPQKPA